MPAQPAFGTPEFIYTQSPEIAWRNHADSARDRLRRPEDKVFGGPNWLDTSRFEIIAKSEKPGELKRNGPSPGR